MNKDCIYKALAEALQKDIDEIRSIDPDAPLSEVGLSSLAMIACVVELEDALGIEVLDSDLLYDNFASINIIFKTLSKYFEPAPASLKKCLILDADNVLWHGISGEEEITIDSAVIRFQSLLLELYHRGVLLCLCSKNDINLIEASFSHPKMLLKREYFAAFVANRNDKASNIIAISDELGLSTESFVFADDSDYELGFVSLNLPDVTVVKVNYADRAFETQIAELFKDVHQTSDLNRTQLYKEQKEREKEKRNFTTATDYNRSLETKYTCGEATLEECARLSELSMRTNQFNLSSARYTEAEIKAMIEDESYRVLSLSVCDKYGDMGIVGMAVLHNNIIEAFMLSCRVFDRDFETVLLNAARTIAEDVLYGIYRDNGKNARFADFYKKNGVETL